MCNRDCLSLGAAAKSSKKKNAQQLQTDEENDAYIFIDPNQTDAARKKDMLDKMLSDLDKSYQEKNAITNQIVDKENSNYGYIGNLLKGLDLFDMRTKSERELDDRAYLGGRKRIGKSYILNLVETKIYKRVPYLRYSKQFINTFTVAFMVVYFFTLFGLRLSNVFGNALIGTVEMIYRFAFKSLIPGLNIEDHNFNNEFRMACFLTTVIITVQLIQTIKTFHNDTIKLHRGEKFFRSLVLAYKEEDYEKMVQKRNKISSTIASDSLHFPGYLVAHLVYGYVLLFFVILSVVLFSKIFYYLPGVSQTMLQILLPVFILVSFKFLFINFLIRAVFLRDDAQRITNLAPYYVITYFNFFFDCFLGLVACMSRIWQTTVISLIRLPRLDKSMFNREDDLLMRRLDKGHLAYLNYVRMEHWYNNPVLTGFCEMLIESMLYSQIYRAKYDSMAKSSITHKSSISVIDEDETNEYGGGGADEYNGSAAPASESMRTKRTKIQLKRFLSTTENTREYNVKEYVISTLVPRSKTPPSLKSKSLRDPMKAKKAKSMQINAINSKGLFKLCFFEALS